jgi:hypothetical protein
MSSLAALSCDVVFVSLGMVVLDELRFPGREPLYDIIGGSGAYGINTCSVPLLG